jgi:hypothetical protein
MPSLRSWRDRRVARCVATVATITVLAALCSSCRGQPEGNRSTTYRPFYSIGSTVRDEPRGTLPGDYQWAASSTTQEQALARWLEFLQKHRPPDGEYQDGFQRNYVRSAQYELMRLEYLSGHIARGDELLGELEDVRRQP